MKKVQKKAKAEFKEWKDELCTIIKRQSKLIFNKNGSYQFILPSRLVKLVWSTTIQERIRAEMVHNKLSAEDARKKALTKLREEVEKAHIEYTAAPAKKEQEKSEEEKKKHEEEEKKAAEDLAKLRAELLKQKE
jgi:hypothetical protein